jgi:membrane protease YdiL (CAAX protease family)
VLGGIEHATVAAVLAGTAGACAGLWFSLSRRRGWGWRELGFVRPRRSAWHLCWQVPVALLASLVGAALLGTALGLAPADGSSRQLDVDAWAVGPWALLLVGVCSALVFPAVEEVVFRRVLLDWLVSRMSPLLAVALVTVVFAAVHVVPAIMVYVVFLGLFTSLLRLWYASLWAPLALHAANNSIIALVTGLALAG